MLHDLLRAAGSVDHPFMKAGKAGAPPAVLLITSDKGLAGAFNSNVIRVAEEYRRQHRDAVFYTIGIKARNAARRMGFRDRHTWPLGVQSKLHTAREAARRLTDDFVGGTISEVTLVSSRMISMMSQRPESRQLVPVSPQNTEDEATRPERPAQGAVEFAPSPEFVLARLLPKYLEFTIFAAMLETDAAFYAAQLVAMNNATDNAGKLIDDFTIQMNNARQAAITKELLEIVAGAEALTG